MRDNDNVTVTIEIPDHIAGRLCPEGSLNDRSVLEALALEGYRADLLSESDLRQMLGFESRMDVHGFLKNHGVFLHYTIADLAEDSAVAMNAAKQRKTDIQPNE